MDESEAESSEDAFWAENYLNRNEPDVDDIHLSESTSVSDQPDLNSPMRSVYEKCSEYVNSISFNDQTIFERQSNESDYHSSQRESSIPEFQLMDILQKNGGCFKMNSAIDIETNLLEEWLRSYASNRIRRNICNEILERMPERAISHSSSYHLILSGIVENYKYEKITFELNVKNWVCVQMILVAIRAICTGDVDVSQQFRSSEIYFALGSLFQATAQFTDVQINCEEKLTNGTIKCINAEYGLNTCESFDLKLSTTTDLIFVPFELVELSSFIIKTE